MLIPPMWLPGGHLQTIWSATLARQFLDSKPAYRRERWPTPDGDFIDVDFLVPRSPSNKKQSKGLLILFHGLEGSSSSHYSHAFAEWASNNGFSYAVPHFRGCSGEINLAPRAYHSGDYVEIDWIISKFYAHPERPMNGSFFAVGVSLGGNALMRWAGEKSADAVGQLNAVAAVCAPFDLGASGRALGRGVNRLIYTPLFLRTLKPKAMAKLIQYPGLFDSARVCAARDLYEFDDAFTAPVHGFKSADEYWKKGSAKPYLRRVCIPSMLLNSLNDPFIPADSLPTYQEVSGAIDLLRPQWGGHVGFPQGKWPAHVFGLPELVGGWFLSLIGKTDV